MEGAAAGAALAVSMAGFICLWSGLSRVMQAAGFHRLLARLFRPLLARLFPDSSREEAVFGAICANFTANLLGLGNAATPLGLDAVRKMQARSGSDRATDEMCRFIILNTASVQLLPTTVAALRAAAGAAHPFDLLPCVLFTSAAALLAGEGAAFLFARRSRS